jgi:transposase-like protein
MGSPRKKSCCDVCLGSKGGGLFSTCNPCRAKNCKHATKHYDSALNYICSDCGSVISKRYNYKAGVWAYGRHKDGKRVTANESI